MDEAVRPSHGILKLRARFQVLGSKGLPQLLVTLMVCRRTRIIWIVEAEPYCVTKC